MKKAFAGLLFFLVLCSTNFFAQDSRWAPKAVHTSEKSRIHIPAKPEGTLTKIYSNLGPRKDAYDGGAGYIVSGPASQFGQNFDALPFTPAANSTVTVIRVPLTYYGSGANQVNLSLYSDIGGVPGTILAGPHTFKNLPAFGACCTLATWHLRTGVSVTAATQYWVVADTPTTGAGSDTEVIWDDQAPIYLEAFNPGGGVGWLPYNGDQFLAGEVLGAVP
jgi:hypothetical protein